MNWKRKQSIVDARIMDLVDITKEDLFWFRIETGLDFLNIHYKDRAAVFLASAEYWAWWQQIWMIGDERILNRLVRLKVCRLSNQQYKSFFEPKVISFRPNEVILKAILNSKNIIA